MKNFQSLSNYNKVFSWLISGLSIFIKLDKIFTEMYWNICITIQAGELIWEEISREKSYSTIDQL